MKTTKWERLSYKHSEETPDVMVFLDNKKVGKIKCRSYGYRYYPKGAKTGGELFPTLEECQKSLEE